MVSEELLKELAAIVPLKERQPMDALTSFRAGGNARAFVTILDHDTLEAVHKLLLSYNADWFLLGNGSNLLVSDAGYDGVVIKLGGEFEELDIADDILHAGAAANISKAALMAAQAGLSGLEFAAGIPGSVGGALAMNAGAFGGEMKSVVERARILFYGEEAQEYTNEQLKLGYRHSIMNEKPGIITDVHFRLHTDDKGAIIDRMDRFREARIEKQPLDHPSAGSFFKRPEGHYAGKLIADAGLKGLCVGGAAVSEKHAGFIINKGGASAADIYRLMKEVQKRVREQSGVELMPEVILLGDFETDA